MGIVEEIIVACKTVLDGFLTDYDQIPYEYLPASNDERSLYKKYGFTAGPATFAEGRAMGFTTINQTFTLMLVDNFQNKDSDESLRTALHNQYFLIQESLKELQKSRLQLPTATNQVLLISGLTIDEAEIIEDNGIVVLRANFNIQYKYRNN